MLSVLKIVNRTISLIVLFTGIYIIIFPVLPEILFNAKKASTKNDGFIYASIEAPEEIIPELKPIPKENRLVIPKISVDGEINTGGKESLDKGLWLRPDTSNPSLGGNTVIVAHRFLYSSGPITFYHLDKMKKNDKFSIYWEGKEYVYSVYDIFEVTPDQVQIEEQTKENIVTLYTCTPLYTSEKRLVVRAKLIEQ